MPYQLAEWIRPRALHSLTQTSSSLATSASEMFAKAAIFSLSNNKSFPPSAQTQPNEATKRRLQAASFSKLQLYSKWRK